ncbi:MAG: hypothetical protein KKF44_09735 [Nanoarchaeota archaeon]|nr:hypothetical protein [Nanoarchaeota archaeon]
MTSKDNSEKVKVFANLEVHEEEGYVAVSVNPKIYPLDIVYSASYCFLDRAYVVLGGDPNEEILVELRHKEGKKDLETLGRDFNNELINYAVYNVQSLRNQGIRDAIVSKAIGADCGCEDGTELENEEISEDDYIDDPLGIAKPWEETHGKGN